MQPPVAQEPAVLLRRARPGPRGLGTNLCSTGGGGGHGPLLLSSRGAGWGADRRSLTCFPHQASAPACPDLRGDSFSGLTGEPALQRQTYPPGSSHGRGGKQGNALRQVGFDLTITFK